MTILESLRILKPEGLLYINAPSNGYFHQYPFDYFRYYPDAGLSFQNWAIHNNYNSSLVESFIGYSKNGVWNDFVAVLIKDKNYIKNYKSRIINSGIDFYNGRTDSSNKNNK